MGLFVFVTISTHICTDRLARPESPTTNTAPSDKSIDRPIHFQ